MADIFDEIAAGVSADSAPLAVQAQPQGDIFDQIAAETPEPTMLQKLWGDIVGTPAAAWGMVKSIPTGISNLAHLPSDAAYFGNEGIKQAWSAISGDPYIPSGTFDELQTREERAVDTLGGLGTLGAGVAGGVVTKAAAPLGISASTVGLDKILQAVGIEPETTAEQDLAHLRTGTIQNALLMGGAKAASAVGSKLLGPIDELANSIDRKSLGARTSDYGKASDTRTVESPSGVTETFVKSALDDLLENNKLGTSRSPAKLSKILQEKSLGLASQIDDVIKKFDDASEVPAEPYFGGAKEYLDSGKVPADLVPTYLDRLRTLDKAIRQEGEGSLSYLQQQKVAFGKSYDPADKVLSGFNRAIYNDLKTSIEQYAPEIKPLNKELAKYIVTEPIVNRTLKAAENVSPVSQLRDLLYTTGGIGAPTYIGSVLGGPVGTAIGATTGLATKALASPTGQATIAKTLRAVSDVPAAEIAASASSIDEPKASKSKQSLNNVLGDQAVDKVQIQELDEKEPVSVVLDKIKADPVDHAIALLESDMNPKAKNPDSTASGLFQLIKGTAKNLGVKDVFNAAENYNGYQKLKKEAIDRFGSGDLETVYSAHYLGAPVYQKVLDGDPLTETQAAQVKYLRSVLLPRLEKIYGKLVKDTDITQA